MEVGVAGVNGASVQQAVVRVSSNVTVNVPALYHSTKDRIAQEATWRKLLVMEWTV